MSDRIEEWLQRQEITLDLVPLTDEQRRNGSVLLGGSAARFVLRSEAFEFNQVQTIVFRWGDPAALDVMAARFEHDDNPDPELFFPFHLAAIIGDWVWSLVIQDRDFDPRTAYRSEEDRLTLAFDERTSAELLAIHASLPTPRPQIISRVGSRWVLFEMATRINEESATTERTD